jgi:hypothetical protein
LLTHHNAQAVATSGVREMSDTTWRALRNFDAHSNERSPKSTSPAGSGNERASDGEREP